MSRHAKLVVICFCLGLTTIIATRAVAQKTPTFVTIDVPGATKTEVRGINASGSIVGSYEDSAGVTHGFLQLAGDSIQTIDVPGARKTVVNSINYVTVIYELAGWYVDSAGVTHGFLDNIGNFTTIDFPNAIFTQVWGMAPDQTPAGTYALINKKLHGFRDNISVDFPGARSTTLTAINDVRDFSGFYIDTSGMQHGFVSTHAGGGQQRRYIDVTAPGSGVVVTAVTAFNQNLESVGYYGTSFQGPFTGFHKTRDTFFDVVFPGSTDTRCFGVSDLGVIVGRYTDTQGTVHGFQMTP